MSSICKRGYKKIIFSVIILIATFTVAGTISFADATFSRPSSAVKSDGTTVGNNMPRYEAGKSGQGITVEEGITNYWRGGFNIYNNYGSSNLQTTVTTLSETYLGQPITRVVYQPLTTTSQNDIRGTYGNHGVYGSYFTYQGSTYYATSIYWRCSDSNVTVQGSPSNIGGWGSFSTVSMGNGWNRSIAIMYRSNAAADNKFWGFMDPAINVNDQLTIDWVCPQIEVGSAPTNYVNGSQAAEILTVPTAGVLNASQGTIETWVNVNNSIKRNNANAYIFSCMTDTTASKNVFALRHTNQDSSNQWTFWTTDGSTSYAWNTGSFAQAADTLSNGWHHFAVRWTSSSVDLFIDGSKAASTANPKIPAALGSNIYIGSNSNNGEFADTVIDDFRVYTRALTDAEIASVYTSGIPANNCSVNLNFDNNLKSITNTNLITTVTTPSNNQTMLQTDKPSLTGTVQNNIAGNVDIWFNVLDSTGYIAVTDTKIGSVSVNGSTASNFSFTGANGLNLSSITASGSYTLQVWGVDANSGVGPTVTTAINVNINQSPVITISLPSQDKTYYKSIGHDTITLSGKVYDTEGESTTISATLNGKTKTVTINNPPTTAPSNDNWSLAFNITTDQINNGSYTANVTATDNYGSSFVFPKTITVTPIENIVQDNYSWSELPKSPGDGLDNPFVLSTSSKVVSVGGSDKNGNITSKMYIYDIPSKTWIDQSANGINTSIKSCGAVSNDKLYIIPDAASSMTVYDPVANTKNTVATSSDSGSKTARNYAALTTVSGKLYLIGGLQNDGLTYDNYIWMYDTSAGTWTKLTTPNINIAGHYAFNVGGKIYIIGGQNSGSSLATQVLAWDPSTSTMITNSPAPISLNRIVDAGWGGTVSNGKIYFKEGNTTYIYTPANDSWDWAEKQDSLSSLSNWTTLSGTFTANGQLTSSGTSNELALYNESLSDIQLTTGVSFTSGTEARIIFRSSDDGTNKYYLDVTASTLSVVKSSTSGDTQLYSITRNIDTTVSHTYNIILLGSNIAVWEDGIAKIAIEDNAYTSGKCGFSTVSTQAGLQLLHIQKINETTYTTQSTELVTNGTFNTDLTGWTIVNGDSSTVTSVNGRMRITGTASDRSATQNITVTGGKVILLRGIYSANGSNNSMTINYKWQNSGTDIGSWNNGGTVSINGNKRISLLLLVPQNANTLVLSTLVKGAANASGYGEFGNISAEYILPNGFYGLANLNNAGLSSNNGTLYLLSGLGNIVVEGKFNNSGAGWQTFNAAKLMSESGPVYFVRQGNATDIAQKINLTPGRNYQFRYKVRKGTATVRALVYLKFYDSTNTEISGSELDNYYTPATGSWEQDSWTQFTVPAGTCYAKLFVSLESGTGTHDYTDIELTTASNLFGIGVPLASPKNTNLLDYFLSQGGKALWLGNTPFTKYGGADGSVSNWTNNMLGFGAATSNDAVTLTQAGTSAGLANTWTSKAAVSAQNVTLNLAQIPNGNAAAWNKTWNTSPANRYIIKDWLITGPISSSDSIPEGSTQPYSGMISKTTVAQASQTWTEYNYNNTYLDFNSVYGDGTNKIAYGNAYVYSSISQHAKLKVTSSNTVSVWLNGTQVTGDVTNLDITLGKGLNDILLKCSGSLQSWGLTAEVVPDNPAVVNRIIQDTQGGNNLDNVYINNWLLCGPFYNGNWNESQLNTDFIGEVGITPTVGMVSGGNTWTSYTNPRTDGLIDLTTIYGVGPGGTNCKVVYGYTTVYSGDLQDCKLRVYADDRIKAWVNDAVVYNGYARWTDESSPVPNGIIDIVLKKGMNKILVKIYDWGGGYNFRTRVATTQPGPAYIKIIPNSPQGQLTRIYDVATDGSSTAAQTDVNNVLNKLNDNKIVYYDTGAYFRSSWSYNTDMLNNYLVSQGFIVKGAVDLKAWMLGRINSKTAGGTVVVLTSDMVPDTIAETMDANCTLRRYLNAGGKIIWLGDYQLYYRTHNDGTYDVWGGAGSQSVLGINTLGTGPTDVTLTSTATSMGLTGSWKSYRPIYPNQGVIPLATTANGYIAGWIKNYNSNYPNSGFVRLYDVAGLYSTISDAENNIMKAALYGLNDNNIVYSDLRYPTDWVTNPSSLASYLSSSIKDLSGNGNNGIIYKATTVNDSTAGQCLSFDGSSSYVDSGNNSITGTSPFTLVAWINTNNINSYTGAVSIGKSASNASAYIGTVGSAQVGTSNSIGGGFYGHNYGSGVTTTGQWIQVAMTFSGGTNGTVNLYVNGVLKVTDTYTPTLTSDYRRIGTINNDSNYYFNGLIANAQIYNCALSATDIQNNYNLGIQNQPILPGAVLAYNFGNINGNFTTITADQTSTLQNLINSGQAGSTKLIFTQDVVPDSFAKDANSFKVTETTATITWANNSIGESGFNIYVNGQKYTTIYSDMSSDFGRSYTTTITGLNPQTTYNILITPVYYNYTEQASQGSEGTGLSISVTTSALAVPVNLIATPSTNSPSVTLSWIDNSTVETEFEIYVNGTYNQTVQSTTQTTTGTLYSVSISNLNNGTSYTFGVKAVWADKKSDMVSINTTTIPAAPTALRVVDANNIGSGWSNTSARAYVVLGWDPIPGATAYGVYMWDGNQYWKVQEVTTTTWDSRQALIYPPESDLDKYQDDSVPQGTNLFKTPGTGMDLRDQPTKLYVKTWGTYYNTSTNYWFRISAKNSAGETNPWNNCVCPSFSLRTDTTPPTGSITINGSALTTKNPTVSLSILAQDTQSGVSTLEFSEDNSTWSQKLPYTSTMNWTLSSSPGTKTLYCRITDNAGNSAVYQSSIQLLPADAPPTLSITINSGASITSSGTVMLNISASDDDTATNNLLVRFSNDNTVWSGWMQCATTQFQWTLATGDGAKTVYGQCKDSGGNITSAVAYVNLVTQLSANTVMVSKSTGYISDVTVNGVTYPASRSKIIDTIITAPSNTVQMCTSWDGITWSPYENASLTPLGGNISSISKELNFQGNEGWNVFYVKLKDSNGVESNVISQKILLDTKPPVVSLSTAFGATATSASTIDLIVSASDNVSSKFTYSVNGGQITALPDGGRITVNGIQKGNLNLITIKVYDEAGNSTTQSIRIWGL